MSNNSPISRFENFARGLIEGSFDRLLRQPGPVSEVASSLTAAADGNQRAGLTANHYVVSVHPDILTVLQQQTADIAAMMVAMLARHGEQSQLVFAGEVQVEFLADASIPDGKVVVLASQNVMGDEPTAVLRSRKPRQDVSHSEESQPKRETASLRMSEAYLIINGRRHVALDKVISTIGRALDNDIVLDDPGVSRSHAQIRWRNGRFEIFDLGSRAGTLVNGQAMSSRELRSGDVITLGSAAVIFGQEDQQANAEAAPKRTSVDITQELSVDEMP